MKKFGVGLLALSMLLCSSCGGQRETAGKADASASVLSVVSFDLPEKPKEGSTDENGTLIRLDGTSASCEGDGVTVEGNTVTVTASGTYVVSGSLTGSLCVDTAETEKVTLILNGACVKNENGAALCVLSCPKKVTVKTAADSVNLLLSKGDEAALESKEDLVFAGDGELYVSSDARGIHSKDDIVIESGALFVSAGEDGIHGKDSVTVSGGEVTVAAEGNGIRSSGDEADETKGNITVSGGDISVTSSGDAVDAVQTLVIADGTLAAVTGGGSVSAEPRQGEGFGPGGRDPGNFDFGGWGGREPRDPGNFDFGDFGGHERMNVSLANETSNTNETASAKGLKAGANLTVSGGTIDLDCADDALHANGVLTVSGGSLRLQSGDDGLHADDTLTVSDGNIEILTSYEGLEADILRIDGGKITVTASDDGINAGIKTTDMGFGGMGGFGGRGGQPSSSPSENGLFITGGTVTLNASGDGLDSNSDVTMSGGIVTVYGPTNSGNGPLDYGGTFLYTGGSLVAVGSSGMAQSVTNEGDGGVLFVRVRGNENSTLTVTDESGNELLHLTPPKQYECLVFASDKLKKNETYTVTVDGSSVTATAD